MKPSERLHAFLTEDGRSLVNFKFFAGSNPTPEGVCAEAIRVLKLVRSKGLVNNPPRSGVAKITL